MARKPAGGDDEPLQSNPAGGAAGGSAGGAVPGLRAVQRQAAPVQRVPQRLLLLARVPDPAVEGAQAAVPRRRTRCEGAGGEIGLGPQALRLGPPAPQHPFVANHSIKLPLIALHQPFASADPSTLLSPVHILDLVPSNRCRPMFFSSGGEPKEKLLLASRSLAAH